MGRRSVRLNADEMEKFFEAGADLPVMGVTPDQLVSLKTTTIVIPGDDNTPSSESGRTAYRMTQGCEMHDLGLDDVDIALIPYPDWAPSEPEIVNVLTKFLGRN